jgi:hypothetical protein
VWVGVRGRRRREVVVVVGVVEEGEERGSV